MKKSVYSIPQISGIENQNKISLMVCDLLVFKGKSNMTLSLIRKGKSNMPPINVIHLLQINQTNVYYIMDIDKFLKSFYVSNSCEICKHCLI